MIYFFLSAESISIETFSTTCQPLVRFSETEREYLDLKLLLCLPHIFNTFNTMFAPERSWGTPGQPGRVFLRVKQTLDIKPTESLLGLLNSSGLSAVIAGRWQQFEGKVLKSSWARVALSQQSSTSAWTSLGSCQHKGQGRKKSHAKSSAEAISSSICCLVVPFFWLAAPVRTPTVTRIKLVRSKIYANILPWRLRVQLSPYRANDGAD